MPLGEPRLTLTPRRPVAGKPEAFELNVRPALDSFDAAIDRVKMQIYTTFAKYGLPCPVTGHGGAIGAAAVAAEKN